MLSNVAFRLLSGALTMCRTRRSSAPPALRVPCQSPAMSCACDRADEIRSTRKIRMLFMTAPSLGRLPAGPWTQRATSLREFEIARLEFAATLQLFVEHQ